MTDAENLSPVEALYSLIRWPVIILSAVVGGPLAMLVAETLPELDLLPRSAGREGSSADRAPRGQYRVDGTCIGSTSSEDHIESFSGLDTCGHGHTRRRFPRTSDCGPMCSYDHPSSSGGETPGHARGSSPLSSTEKPPPTCVGGGFQVPGVSRPRASVSQQWANGFQWPNSRPHSRPLAKGRRPWWSRNAAIIALSTAAASASGVSRQPTRRSA